MTRFRLSHLWRDTRGAIAPMVAILSATLLGAAALSLDVGLYYSGKRGLEAATKAAALAAASSGTIDAAGARKQVRDYLDANKFPNAVISSIEVGRYCADSSITSGSRFIANKTSGCTGDGASDGRYNALRVKTAQPTTQYALALLGRASPIAELRSTATAARIDEAGLEMTSGLLTLDRGLVNSLLTVLTGININLSTAQLQSLVTSNIDAGRFFDALAARVGETGNYSDLVRRTVPLNDLLLAAATAATASSSTTTAASLQTLAGMVGSSISVPLAGLFDLGVWEKMPVGNSDTQPGLRAGINSYQLLAFAIQTNNRSGKLNGIQVNAANIVKVDLLATASGPVERARFAFGPAGETTANTSALRLKLNVQINGLGSILNGVPGLSLVGLLLSPLLNALNVLQIDLPLLIDISPSSASVSSIVCGQEAATNTSVFVNAKSGLINVFLGTPKSDPMTQPFNKYLTVNDFNQVPAVNLLGLLSIDIKAAVGSVTEATNTLEFRQGSGAHGVIGKPPYGGVVAHVRNQSQLLPLLTNLTTNMSVSARLLGIETGQLVQNVLTAVIRPVVQLGSALPLVGGVDPLVDSLLQALGIQLGTADVWVTGARCGVPVLV